MSAIQLLTAAAAANGPPTATTDGFPTGDLRSPNQVAIIAVNLSAGAGDAITLRLWGRTFEFPGGVGVWMPVGVAVLPAQNSTKGTLNNGNAILANGAPLNSASHTEVVDGLRSYSALYMEAQAVVGSWDVAAVTRDPGNRGEGLVN